MGGQWDPRQCLDEIADVTWGRKLLPACAVDTVRSALGPRLSNQKGLGTCCNFSLMRMLTGRRHVASHAPLKAQIASRRPSLTSDLNDDMRCRQKVVSTLTREAHLPPPERPSGDEPETVANAGFFGLSGRLESFGALNQSGHLRPALRIMPKLRAGEKRCRHFTCHQETRVLGPDHNVDVSWDGI